jgi:hypothetical protein
MYRYTDMKIYRYEDRSMRNTSTEAMRVAWVELVRPENAGTTGMKVGRIEPPQN